MRGALAAVAAAAARHAAAGPRELPATYGFADYAAEFGKAYPPAERGERAALFATSLRRARAHNAEYRAGRRSWWMEVNRLADWTPAELRRLRAERRGGAAPPAAAALPSTRQATNPPRVDWREQGVVTPVRDQGSCGSCWAFSAAEALESHYAIASGRLVGLAPQALVDCVTNPGHCGGSGGCKGATMELAFNFTAQQGIPLEADLPYAKHGRACEPYAPAVKNAGYTQLPANDAAALETAIATKGPVSVIVAALTWQLYGGGVYQGCSEPLPSLGNELDHGVLAVGYGVDGGLGYWLVRNSWGKWGENGYIRISRANDAKTFVDDDPPGGVACKPYPKTQLVGGECGILFDTSYPTGVHNATAQA